MPRKRSGLLPGFHHGHEAILDRARKTLLVDRNELRCALSHLQLPAHFLKAGAKSFNVLLLFRKALLLLYNHRFELSEDCLLLLNFLVLFEEFVE